MSIDRLDRYILNQLLGPFGFFALVFTGIIWLTQALGLVDRVIVNNQSALVFLEFSTLILPRVMASVLAIAAFGAAIFATNRLYAESELVVVMASGRSHLRLTVPFLLFGVIAMAISYALTLYLVPISAGRLADRMYGIRNDVTNSLIGEGEFVHPSSNVTIYVKDTSRNGEMVGIFLHDQRDPDNAVTYTARKALLLSEGDMSRLIMFDGIAQSSSPTNDTLSTVKFVQFAYDLSDIASERVARQKPPSEYQVSDLLSPSPAMLNSKRYRIGDYVAEAHNQISSPILALVFPVLAMASTLSGQHRRNGNALRIAMAVALAAAIQLAAVLAKSYVSERPEHFIVSYLPAIAAMLAAAILITRSSAVRLPSLWRKLRT